MLSKSLENWKTSYDIFVTNFGKKARVYYTLSIFRGGGAGPRAQAPAPPGFATNKGLPSYMIFIILIVLFVF